MIKYFNSIKVRLEHNKSIATVDASTFQFHKGAIRTWLVLPRILRLPYFNSIKVRLEQNMRENLTE